MPASQDADEVGGLRTPDKQCVSPLTIQYSQHKAYWLVIIKPVVAEFQYFGQGTANSFVQHSSYVLHRAS